MGGGIQPKVLEVEVLGGMGEKKSNGGQQYYQQDRIYNTETICPALNGSGDELVPKILDKKRKKLGAPESWVWEIDGQKYQIRIRKLTPKECWRLMGFTDDEFQKAESVVSNTQLYKQAGNSIVVDVLENVFRQMILQRSA